MRHGYLYGTVFPRLLAQQVVGRSTPRPSGPSRWIPGPLAVRAFDFGGSVGRPFAEDQVFRAGITCSCSHFCLS